MKSSSHVVSALIAASAAAILMAAPPLRAADDVIGQTAASAAETRPSQSLAADSDPLAVVGLGTEVTVLLVLEPDCDPCLQSMAFYKSLAALPRMDGLARRLVVIGRKGVIPVQAMLDSRQFKPHRLTSGPRTYVEQIAVVPTVIVLGPGGKRLGTWPGRLTADQEGAVKAVVSRTK